MPVFIPRVPDSNMTDVLVHVGVDVGGTYTDAVVMGMSRDDPTQSVVISTAKHATTTDVTTGVCKALGTTLDGAVNSIKPGEELKVQRIHIGTTQFINAVVQRKGLCKVAALRLCGPATVCLPPFVDFPPDLTTAICGGIELLDGGYEFDGITEIRPVQKEQVLHVIKKLKEKGLCNVVITGVYSPVNAQQEKQVETLFKEHYPEASLTLSHAVGHVNLLERENASILNESLKPLCRHTLTAYQSVLQKLGLKCPIYLTQNDGTLTSIERALMMPILTFASGPTNSMRGAAFLAGNEKDDAMLVIDIGGTTTDVGTLLKGFPRETQLKVKVGGVITNFRMPDVLSFGLGGGSLIIEQGQDEQSPVAVGPRSTGYRLTTEGLVFGGSTLTASDIAVACGITSMGNPQKVKHLDPQLTETVMNIMRSKLEDAIDQIKTNKDDMPVILVGGGSVLIETSQSLKGTSRVFKPPHFDVANAVGAALSKVSGTSEQFCRGNMSREETMETTIKAAKEQAIQAGADPNTLEITEKRATDLQYIHNATHIKVKVVGNLLWDKNISPGWPWKKGVHETVAIGKDEATQQMISSTGQLLEEDEHNRVQETAPLIDPATGDWILSEWDIACMSVGCTLLGCGGGGNPYSFTLLALREMKQGKEIRIIKPETIISRMKDENRVANIAFIGAPSVLSEKLPTDKELQAALDCMQNLYTVGMFENDNLHQTDGTTVREKDGLRYIENYQPAAVKGNESHSDTAIALTGVEIGGMNGMGPLFFAARAGLPVVDCDMMGRAFPELQDCSLFIEGGKPYPAAVADVNGTSHAVLYAKSSRQLEKHCRDVCVKMGCYAALAFRPLTREDISLRTIHHSYSQAWYIGRAVLRARKKKVSPISAILEHGGGKLLGTGKVHDVVTELTGGFNKGKVTIEIFEDNKNSCFIIHFQNEFLICQRCSDDGSHKTIACTPNLICMVDTDTGEPVPVDEVRYGLRVTILTLPVSPLMSSPRALQEVGPQAFGYSEDVAMYTSVGSCVVDAFPWLSAESGE